MTRADLSGVDLSSADLRDAILVGAKLDAAKLTGAKVAGLVVLPGTVSVSQADWVDTSVAGDGSKRAQGDTLRQVFAKDEPVQPHAPTNRRYFGHGDVLRNASLQFDDGAIVEIESLFEQCTITLGKDTDLVIGKNGVLADCQITGAGNITVHGHFFERVSPGIVGAKQVMVTAGGSLVGAVEQPASPTRFAFEAGCNLRMKILQPKSTEPRRD